MARDKSVNRLKKLPKKPLLLGLALLFGATWLYSWANQPTTTILGETTANGALGGNSDAQGAILTSSYFSTILPGNLAIKTHNTKPKGSALEQLLAADASGTNSDQLAITIANLPADGLENVSDVIFRDRATDQYERVELDWAPAGVIAFQKKSNYEFSVFWAKNGRYAAIVTSGGVDRRQSLDDTMSRVLRSWRWQ